MRIINHHTQMSDTVETFINDTLQSRKDAQIIKWKWYKNDVPRAILRRHNVANNKLCSTNWYYHNNTFARKLYPKTIIFAAMIGGLILLERYVNAVEGARRDAKYEAISHINAKLKQKNEILEKVKNESERINPDINYIRRKMKKVKVNEY